MFLFFFLLNSRAISHKSVVLPDPGVPRTNRDLGCLPNISRNERWGGEIDNGEGEGGREREGEGKRGEWQIPIIEAVRS